MGHGRKGGKGILKGEGHRFWRMSRVMASSYGVILFCEGLIAK